jgi:hypothetical protein
MAKRKQRQTPKRAAGKFRGRWLTKMRTTLVARKTARKPRKRRAGYGGHLEHIGEVKTILKERLRKKPRR